MRKPLIPVNRAITIIGITLLLLASACGGTDAAVGTEDVATDGSVEGGQGVGDDVTMAKVADELRGFFEATEWEIIERSGFETSTTGGTVSFVEVEQIVFMGLTTSDNVNGSLMIQWNDEGFTSVADDQGFTGSHDDAGTVEPDLFQFLDGGRYLTEIYEDGSMAILSNRGRTLVLTPRA